LLLGPLKNAIDWVSRPYNANYEICYDMSSVVLPLSGKATATVGATPGDYGNAGTGRGQFALRQALIYPNSIMVNHPVVSVPKATTAFEDNGSLKSQVHADALRQLLVNLVKLGKQLATDVKV
jgi:NAD(P)H-dependent FMN reductase